MPSPSSFSLLIVTGLFATIASTLHGQDDAAARCPLAGEYSLATRIGGELTVGDCAVGGRGVPAQPVDAYRLRVGEQRTVTVALDAPGMRAVRVGIYRVDGVAVRDKVTADGFAVFEEQLAPGEYRLVIHNAVEFEADRRFGSYTLTTSTGESGFGGCLALPEVSAPETVSGSWSISDCKTELSAASDARIDFYLVSIAAERELSLDLDSPGVDAHLVLYRRDGVEVASAGGMLQRQSRLDETVAPGVYVIGVRPDLLSERQTGSYTLRVH